MRRRRVKPSELPSHERCGLTRKARFSSESAADKALSMLKRQAEMRPRRQERRAYKCWYCHGWHLTSQEKRS